MKLRPQKKMATSGIRDMLETAIASLKRPVGDHHGVGHALAPTGGRGSGHSGGRTPKAIRRPLAQLRLKIEGRYP